MKNSLSTKFAISISVFILYLSITPCAVSTEWYEGVSRTVVRLEHADVISRQGQRSPKIKPVSDGTAFIVRFHEVSFLISARHVVEKDYDLFSRITILDSTKTHNYVKKLHLPKNSWVFHPSEHTDSIRAVDIAVCKLPSATEFDGTYKYISESTFSDSDPTPPLRVVAFGFPGALGFELSKQRPMGREGIVSLTAEEPYIKLDGKYMNEKVAVLDMEMFPGNSGSPVFTEGIVEELEGNKRVLLFQLKLSGLIIATNLERDYSIMEPISSIQECLEHALANPISEELTPTWGDKK